MKALLMITILFFLTITIVHAQEKYQLPSDLRCETNITEPLTLRKGYFRTSLGYALAPYDRYFDRESGTSRLLNSSGLTLSGVSSYMNYYILGFRYGLTNDLSVGIDFWYIKSENFFQYTLEIVPLNDITKYNQYKYSKGFNDMNLSLSYQFYKKRDFFSSIDLDIKIPTGSTRTETIVNENYTSIREPVSSNDWEIGIGLKAKKIIYPFSLYFAPSISQTFGNERREPWTSYSLHTSSGILLNDWFSVNNSWSINYTPIMTSKSIDIQNKNMYSIFTGIQITQQVKQFRFYQMLKFPIAGSHGFPTNMNLLFSLSYTF
jgi:hypothetical protein